MVSKGRNNSDRLEYYHDIFDAMRGMLRNKSSDHIKSSWNLDPDSAVALRMKAWEENQDITKLPANTSARSAETQYPRAM